MIEKDLKYIRLTVPNLKLSVFIILKGTVIKSYSDEPFSRVFLKRLNIESLPWKEESLIPENKVIEDLNKNTKSKLELMYSVLRIYALEKKLSL